MSFSKFAQGVRPLLTIGIPTYSRPGCLENQLKSLAAQIDPEREAVEILVCDNASPQNLVGIIDSFRTRLPTLIFHRNSHNLGFFGNVYQTYHLAGGRYVWFLSDDDELLDGAVARVLQELHSEAHTVLTFGAARRVDYYSWAAPEAVSALGSTIFISSLVLRKDEIDTAKWATKPVQVFPQVTLSLLLLNREFHLARRNFPLVKRNIGHVTNDFFRLYCLDLLEAIRQAAWPEAQAQLIGYFRRQTLKEFVMLQFWERVGRFQSRNGLPWASWKRGWGELGNDLSSRLRLLAILAISRVPAVIALGICRLFLIVRYWSWNRASETISDWLEWQNQSEVSDV